MNYIIMTDASSDLPWSYTAEHGIHCIPMTAVIGSDTVVDDANMDVAAFYTRLRAGEVASTSQISTAQYIAAFEPILQQGKDILLMGLSVALSESYTNACTARNEIAARYPERRIYVCETTCVSLGLGLFVHEARKRRDKGMSFDELCRWVEEYKSYIHHRFIVEDLMFLHRGGRVSRGSAVVGTLMGIRPLLHVSRAGKLINHGKIRGRKQTLMRMVEDMMRFSDENYVHDVFITHGDCEEDARFVMEEIKKRRKVDCEIIRYLGSTIGAHTGAGCVALFYNGNCMREVD